jgi:hypothetical protein
VVQILRDPNRNPQSFGETAATGLAQGLSSGLQSILAHKVENLRRQPLIQELQALGVDPRDAAFIVRLKPEDQLKALQSIRANDQNQQQTQQQFAPGQYPHYPQQGNYQEQQQQPYRSSLLGGQQNTPQQLKHADAIISQQQNLEDIVATTDRMLGTLKEGISLGILPGVASTFAPTLLSKQSELFDKDASHIVNLTSADIKGVPSQLRVRLIEKEKPGLKHSEAVNRQILERLNADARNKLNTLSRRYPTIAQYGQQQPEFEQLRQQDQQEVSQQNQEQQPPSEESPLGTVARAGVRTAARAGESLLGAAGDIPAALLGIGNWATSGAIPSYHQAREALPFLPPTSDDIKQFTGKISGGYTNPRGTAEETVDDLVSTVSSFFLPGKLKVPFAKNLEKILSLSPETASRAANIVLPFSGVPLSKAIKIGSAGVLASKVAEGIGGGPITQAGAKLAAMSLASSGLPRKYLTEKVEELYKKSNESIKGPLSSKNTIPINSTISNVKAFKRKIDRAGGPNRQQLIEITEQVENGLIKSKDRVALKGLKGRASVADLVDQKKKINQWFGLSTQQRVAHEQFLSPTARKEVKELGEIIEKPLIFYGNKNHVFGMSRAIANDIFHGLSQAENIGPFMKGFGGTFSTSVVSTLVKDALRGITGNSINKTRALHTLFSESKHARDYYYQALKAASENNINAFVRAVSQLDKEGVRIEKKR